MQMSKYFFEKKVLHHKNRLQKHFAFITHFIDFTNPFIIIFKTSMTEHSFPKQNIYIHENFFVFQKLTNPTLFRCSNDKSNHVRDLKYMKQLCFNAGASAVLLAF